MPAEKFHFTGNSLSKSHLFSALGSLIRGKSNQCLSISRKLIADFFQVSESRVFMFSAGRMSVYALLKSLKLTHEDEVLVAGYTCVVLTNAVKFTGQPVTYVDIKAEDFNVNTSALLSQITERTKVLILPHNFGIPYSEISRIKESHPELIVIEDVAHSFGSKDKNGQLCGTLGDASFFSLEYSKPMTCGMGGIMIINNHRLLPAFENLYKNMVVEDKLSALRKIITLITMVLTRFRNNSFFQTNGMRFLRYSRLGYATSKQETEGILPENYPTRIHPWLTCILVPQLRNIETINLAKRKIAKRYADFLGKFRKIQKVEVENAILIRYPLLFSEDVSIDQIKAFKREAASKGYRFGEWFNDVVHPKGSFRYMYKEGTCKVGEWVAERILNLPVNAYFPPSDVHFKELEELIRKHGLD